MEIEKGKSYEEEERKAVEQKKRKSERAGHGEQFTAFHWTAVSNGTMLVPHFLHNLENGAAPSTDGTEYTGAPFFLDGDGATKIAGYTL